MARRANSRNNTCIYCFCAIYSHNQYKDYKVQWTNGRLSNSVNTSNTSYTVTGLTPGVNYTFNVTAVAGDGVTAGTPASTSTFTNPDVVGNLQVSIKTTSSVSLNWNLSNGNSSSYRVQWNNGKVSNSTNTSNTSYTVTGLTPGVKYTFSVTAVAGDGVTAGAPASISIFTNPDVVTNLTASDQMTSSLSLNWNSSNGNSSFYRVQWTAGKVSNSTNTSNTSYAVTGLTPGVKYTFSVTAVAGDGVTAGAPASISIFTNASPVLDYNCEGPNRTTFLNLTWKDPLGSNQGFNITLSGENRHSVQSCGTVCNATNNSIGFLAKNYDDWMKDMTMTYLTVLKTNENTRSSVNTSIEIEIGNNKTGSVNGTNYINGPLDAQRKYSSALVLFTYLKITGGLVDISDSFFSISPFVTLLNPKPSNTVAIVLGVLSIIILMIIITIILVFIIQKRRTKKNETEIPVNTLSSIPVRVEDYEAYFKKQQADSNCGFAEEYENIKVVGTAQAKISALALENKVKNRYNNVLPYDISRVKLSKHGSTFDDYINANYIPGYNSKKEYIAAQGPLPVTVNEFWRMIWEKHVQTMVMLTRCNEQGRVKTAESREARHFHFTAWPDHGVPETTEVLINFRHLVREHMDHYSCNSPTIVHCSAGVGRTGTFIALDHLIFQIERESIVDIYGIVHNMRMHRPLMVQTEDQYVFLNQCAVDIIKSRMGTNVDLIYQNATAFHVYGNIR
ncbi:hypothetical protein P4O66_002659 [Electrophorus voltai]|uniref:protein-tyrosine-phosphatase n=1 Tax=Electrophorus voltai TaxID=2609070 RepID=A0AAD9DQX6_9TELE|nr:hypothetical protein P4O66_002659 [Electrophorus voltai]